MRMVEHHSYLENCSIFGRKCQFTYFIKSGVGFYTEWPDGDFFISDSVLIKSDPCTDLFHCDSFFISSKWPNILIWVWEIMFPKFFCKEKFDPIFIQSDQTFLIVT